MKRCRPPPAPRTCLVAGCCAVIAGWKRLCDPCWRRLPFERRREIAEAGEAKAWHQVVALARAAAGWLEQHTPAAEAARRMGEGE